jgi:hypothetical protein
MCMYKCNSIFIFKLLTELSNALLLLGLCDYESSVLPGRQSTCVRLWTPRAHFIHGFFLLYNFTIATIYKHILFFITYK